VDHKSPYDDDHGELAQISAITAPAHSNVAPAVSLRRKSRKGDNGRTDDESEGLDEWFNEVS
jgi:hypothetical protein